MDEDYDCNMVTAPCGLLTAKEEEFIAIAVKLAGLTGLRGVMDVEVIDHNGALKVLEIDARIPSQTPMAVLHSTGTNLLSELADITVLGKFTDKKPKLKRYVSIEHHLIDETGVHNKGERIMGEGGLIFHRENFFGADEALTDYDGKRLPFRGAFINSAETVSELFSKRINMLSKLKELKENGK
jgi:pyrrolysine biosynthesis protein PylC